MRLRETITATTVLLGCSFAQAQLRSVRLHVQDSQGVSLSDVVLSVQGRTLNRTINGYTTVDLPIDFQPGDSVPVVLVSHKGFAIFPPFSQKFYIPSERPGNEAIIVLVKSKEDQPSAEIIARRAAEILNSDNKKSGFERKLENRDNVASDLNVDPYQLSTTIRSLANTTTDPTLKEIVGRYKQDYPYDFAMAPQFLKALGESSSLQPTFAVNVNSAGRVHSLNNDCEMHIAGTLRDIPLGNPTGMVMEPPNVCMFGPEGKDRNSHAWETLIQDQVIGKNCVATGFPRIFTERGRPVVERGGVSSSNPAHFFELHPLTAIQCGDSRFSFAKFITAFEGMHATSPVTVASCIASRELQIRYNVEQDWFEFRENGSKCGNFAVVEVLTIYQKAAMWKESGHRAKIRITPDGKTQTDITAYTLAPSEVDDWISDTESASERQWHYVHGMLTYDFQAILDATKSKPPNWERVEHAFALVIFGRALSSPWNPQAKSSKIEMPLASWGNRDIRQTKY